MLNFVISDLHVMDRSQKFLFNSDKETAFCRFSEVIFESKGNLILAGDIFDFTGMTPCQNGNLEFFHEVLSSSQLNQEAMNLAGTFRSTKQLLLACLAVYPRFFEVLSKLAEQKRLIYIPGNHDCDFLRSSSQDDLADVLGVAHDCIEWTRQYEKGFSFVVSHGNQFDPPNNTDRGCQNPGFVFTSALYHAVLPA
ncbi:MAG: metallophosphoesterase, partial [Bdellovibrionaceae bacterium]|nr:metallophosphoesterase [Bdellovibrio sp.]